MSAKPKVFVSFDYTNDRKWKYMLEAWNANPQFEFIFDDRSSQEINSWNIGRIKAALTPKINSATHTFVIVGREANKRHPDWVLIGNKNWINWEIAQSKKNKNRLVAIKLDSQYESPDELLNSGAVWAQSFTQESILNALKPTW